MYNSVLKFFFAFAFAFLAYFVGMPGCAPTRFYAIDFCKNWGSEKCSSVTDPEGGTEGRSLLPVGKWDGEITGRDRENKKTSRRDREDERTSRRDRENKKTSRRDRENKKTSRRDREDERTSRRDRENKKTSRRDRENKKTSRRDREKGKSSPPAKRNSETIVYEISLGEIEIIFVIDNSSSMAREHRSIAKQVSRFLSAIKDLDYRIAVITTDISSSPENPVRNAYYQDGKFIPIGRRIYLRNENRGKEPSPQVVQDWINAMVRRETTRCDSRNQPKKYDSDDYYAEESSTIECPSHDERGIYALNKAIRNPKHGGFFDSKTHLMIAVLSDEDNRSSRKYIEEPGNEIYEYEEFDYPEVLVQSFEERFPEKKTFSVHPIIIPPGDRSCLEKQNSSRNKGAGSGRGYYGKEYAWLASGDSNLTRSGRLLKGEVISICHKSYGSQLNKITVAAKTIRIPVPCSQPERVNLYVNNKRIKADYDIKGKTLVMEPGRVPLTSKVELEVTCRLGNLTGVLI